MNRWDKGRRLIHRYLGETSGATLMVFGLTLPMVVGAVGMSVDLARTYLAKERLTHALDAAALAGAASSRLEGAELEQRVEDFFEKNFQSGEVGRTSGFYIEIIDNKLRVSAAVDVDTTFLNVLGISEVTVDSHSVVNREVQGIEVAMVLDVTGSMSSNNNIGALRTAATNFLNIMCTDITCSSSVKVGLVPFSASVNVGPYGLGKNPNGTTYDTAFVNNPSNLKFDQSKNSQWWGCILERTHPEDTMNSQSSWRWDMYRRTDVSNPNNGCNKAYILPLTTSKSTIQSRINGLTASGNTLSNVGMVWGYRVLSPEFPFREGSVWDSPEIRKVALLMTDGDNNIGNTYSAYGTWTNLHLTDHDLDVRLAETCERMKEDGITVYTVTFTSGINAATKEYFRNCASDENKYIDAPTQSDLINAFEQIAAELSNIHVSE